MKYLVKIFGCQMNEHDAEILSGMMEAAGYQLAEDQDAADVMIVHTCCVRESAENKIIGFLGNLKKYKEDHPRLMVVVTGCMVQQPGAAEKLIAKSPHLDVIIGTHNLHRLPFLLQEAMAGDKPQVEIWSEAGDLPETLPVKRIGRIKAQVNIMSGCNNYCSYCIVPYVRGRERSRRPEEILREIQGLAAEGFKELLLLGQNVNSYGMDAGISMDFADLLKEAAGIPGVERIRYMTSHPRDFSRKLIDTIAALDQVCPHIHLPIQSGSDRILALMNRGYTREEYAQLVAQIRQTIPDCSITTDLIVGFPGETGDDFEQTLDLLARLRLDVAYTFLYSRRSGTPAAQMPGQVSPQEKQSRLRALMDRQNQISLEINQSLIGCVEKVLVEGPSRTQSAIYTGRTGGNKIVVFPGSEQLVGQTVPVMINKVKTWHLEGQIIN